MNYRFFILAGASLGIVGCANLYKPAYQNAPIIDLGQSATAPQNSQIELSKWWLSLNDETLSNLIETALAQNFDLAQAAERINEARAGLAVTQTAQGPQGAINTSAAAQRLSENGALPISRFPGISRDQLLFKYGYDASWELDIFGSVRHNIDAAEARIDLSREEANGARVSIAAEVARLYFELRGAQRELAAENAYIASLNQSIALISQRVRAGDLSHRELDELKARKELYDTKIPSLEAKIRAASIGIATLNSRPPETYLTLLNQPSNAPKLMNFPIGARSELLARRPDIRIAERRLSVRTSEGAVAETERYPRFAISTHGGWEAVDLMELFKPGSQNLVIAPSIQWRIFDGGRVEAQIKAANSRTEQALKAYSQTVINAIGDSERALLEYRTSLEIFSVRNEAIIAQRHLLDHQLRRFRNGDISRLETLEAERNLRDLETQNIRNQTQAAIMQIALFKSLGGGWGD